MRKTFQIIFLVLLTAVFFNSFSPGFAEEGKETGKHEEVKKKRAKKPAPGGRKKDTGEDTGKTSESNRVTSGINRTVGKALETTHNGIETIKNDINEGYKKLRSGSENNR